MDVPWIETAARHWRHGRIVGRRFADRRPGIRAALRAAAPDSVLLAGNSHAEFVGTPDLGGRACINIAVGGSTAVDCGRHLAELRVPTRCAAAVLIIGTNDLQRWRHPERARVVDRFEADVRRILRSLEAWSAQVFVAAVPPVGIGATGRDPAAVAVFSDRLARLCAEGPHLLRPVRGVARRHRARRPRSPPGRRASGRLRAPGRGALPRGGGHGPSGRAAAPPGCALSRAPPDARRDGACRDGAPAGPARGLGRPAVRIRALRAARPDPGCAAPQLPLRFWPEDATVWLAENGVRRPRAARHALAALAALGLRGRYEARRVGAGKIVTGPASALALRDSEAEIGFVFQVTPYGYGAEKF